MFYGIKPPTDLPTMFVPFSTVVRTHFLQSITSIGYITTSMDVVAVFPDTLQIWPKVKECLSHDSDYYLFSDFQIYHFIDYGFIEAFVKKGELTALSVDKMLDVENCCCLTPSGILVLSLQRNHFLKLGIEQGPAVKIKNIDNRNLIFINLKEECFNPKKKNFQRVYNRLKATNLKMDIILLWEPEDIKVCPSSVASYFHGKGINCHECNINYGEKRNYEVMLPKFNTSNVEMFEWLGIHLLGGPEINDDDNTQEYLSTYQCPEDSEIIGQVLTLQWAGLVSSKRILKLLNIMREYVSIRPGIPWVALHIHGFDDAPLSWNLQPHKFTTRGDNNYTIIFNSSKNVKVCKTFTTLKKIC
ncbi:ribonuclease P protein subunit p40 isoform X1 [Halyomorpha halys]|uniref:ribonuclease P protein subunit p40 isoform X1 n=2 Tax=Halyomorpha halys TaxID=286706 RepID=UPI0034D25129